jgi:HK97 family phage major capsid protein
VLTVKRSNLSRVPRSTAPRSVVGVTDYANLIPGSVSGDLIRGMIEGSAVLRLARTTRVPAGVTSIPVVSVMPDAGFVAAHGGRKPATVIEWSSNKITPEELACVVAIPDDFIEDNTFPVWDEVRPLLQEAMSVALDDAILWGIGAPASFPAGGVEAIAGAPVTGTTVLEAVSKAMGVVEASGLLPNGHVAGARAKPLLRLLEDSAGRLVYTPALTEGAPDQLFGVPLTYSQGFDAGTTAELLTGDWSKLVVGIRSDIRFELSNEGVLTDGAGVVTANAFQDDLTLMRVYMRVGAAIGRPVNRAGLLTKPFALAEFGVAAGSPGLLSEAELIEHGLMRDPRSSRSSRTDGSRGSGTSGQSDEGEPARAPSTPKPAATPKPKAAAKPRSTARSSSRSSS